MTITPLRKRKPTGELYTRIPEIESLLIELSSLSSDDLIRRAAIPKRTHPEYMPSECLLYLIRASRGDDRGPQFGRLYHILAKRIWEALSKWDDSDEKRESLVQEEIRESVLGHFCELVSADHTAYFEALDPFEVRFDQVLARRRVDAWRKASPDETRLTSLYDEKSGDIYADVEAAAAVSSYSLFAASDYEDIDYRLRLRDAIDSLLPEQRQVIHMLMQEFPIDSQEPDVMTIAKALKRSEKTIRNYRDKAIVALRTYMNDGETI